MNSQTTLSTSIQTSLDSYIAQLSLSKSKLTLDAYRYDITQFLLYLAEKNIKSIKRIKSEHIIAYLGYRKSLSNSESSINRYYMSLKSFFKWAYRTKAIEHDITVDVSVPIVRQAAPRIPSIDEVSRLLEQPNTATEAGLRDRAILELLYSSGLRATELCNLEIQDVTERQVTISTGKRGKTRSVPLTQEAYHWIMQYIEHYRGVDEGYLFQTMMNKQLRRQLLCSIVVDYAMKAGIRGITTHTLRHACATHLLDQGADIRMIQDVLGHSSIASTQRYTHLSSQKIQSMFENFHPRKRDIA